MNRILVIFLGIFGLLTSCDNYEDYRTTDLIGTWHGVGEINRSVQNGESTFQHSPYLIAFTYDNGIKIQAEGNLSGRCTDDFSNPRGANWFDCYPNEGTWSLTNDILNLNGTGYRLISLTTNQLIIWRQVNSDLSTEIILEKQ